MLEQNSRVVYQDDEIDLFELGKKVWRYKKFIFLFTGIVSLFAVIYVFIATPWYKATATIETGHYTNDNNEKNLVANSADSMQKLTVKYIDLLKGVEGLDYQVQKITESKYDKKFFDVEVIAKTNDIAVKQINKIVEDLANEHQKVINGYMELKKIQLANIDSQINFLKNNKIVEKQQQIEYLKSMQIPRLDKQITNLEQYTTLEKDKTNTQDKLIEATLKDMQAERDISTNDKLLSLQKELLNLQTEELNKLLDKKSHIEFILKPDNYQNTHVVSNVIISNKPVKPKRIIIVAIAFLSSLMLSTFGVLCYDAIKQRIDREKQEG